MLTASLKYSVYTAGGSWCRKYCNILLDKDLCEVKQFWKVSFQNIKSLLEIFSGQATKSYSQFASIARHFISSKWTLCAQSIEAVYPGKYTKHWSLLCVWLMRFVIVKWWIILFKAVALELHSVRLNAEKCTVIVIVTFKTLCNLKPSGFNNIISLLFSKHSWMFSHCIFVTLLCAAAWEGRSEWMLRRLKLSKSVCNLGS